MDAMKLGLRAAGARKSRTVLTVLAIGLGVSIMIGVNMGSDMIVSSLAGTLDRNLGHTDVVCQLSWWGDGTPRTQVATVLDSQGARDAGVASWVPRVQRFRWNLAVTPAGNDTIAGLYAYVTGIDTSIEHEKKFGAVKVVSTHPSITSMAPGTITGVEQLLDAVPAITRPVVLSTMFLQANGLNGSIAAGDIIHLENEVYTPEFPGSTYSDPSTWPAFTVVAIVEDLGEMFFYTFFTPYSVFMKMDQLFSLVFNGEWSHGRVTHALVHAAPGVDPVQLATSVATMMETALGITPRAFAPKADFLRAVAPALNVIRIFFTAFAAISLVVCGVLVKNLFEMARQTDIHEIGILKGIGHGSGFIAGMYAVQIVVMAAAGTGVGFLIGTGFAAGFVEILQSSDIARTLLGATFDIQLHVAMTPASAMIGLISGFAIPFVFGMIPVVQTARIPAIDAIQLRQASRGFKRRTTVILGAVVLVAGLALAITGVVLVQGALVVLFDSVYLDFETLVAPLASLFAGIVAFLFGLILAGVFALPVISRAFTWLFLGTAPRALKDICHRTIMRNKRRTVNTFMMVVIGLSFMVTITTITSSISAGAYPGRKTVIGGDIRLGEPFYNHHSMNMTYDDAFVASIARVPGVQSATAYRFATDMSRVSYALGFLGTKIDGFGHYEDITYDVTDGWWTSRTYRESFSLGIIDPVAYHDVNHDAILRIAEPAGIAPATLFQQLDTPGTVMLQHEMKDILGKVIGDTVRVIFEGQVADLTIVAYADILPGFPWTMGLTSYISGWGEGNVVDTCGAISWSTYHSILGDTFRDIDLVIKNRFRQAGMSYNDEPWLFGTLGFPLNATRVNELLAPFIANGTIASTTPVVNNFFPVTSTFRNDRPFDHQPGFTPYAGSWYPFDGSIVGLPGPGEAANGVVQVRSVHPSVPASHSDSVEAILDWFDVHGAGVNACIVPETYAKKRTNPFDTWPGELEFVYSFTPGDVIRVGESPFVQDFTVVATTGTHVNYQYHVPTTGENVSVPAVFNPKSLNVNAYHADGSPYISDLPGMLFMDPSAMLVHRNAYMDMVEPMLEYLESIASWEPFPGVNITSLDVFAEMLLYKNHTDDLANLIFIKAGSGQDIAGLRARLQAVLASDPGTANCTVTNPKGTFLRATRFDQGNMLVGVSDRNRLGETLDAIERLHEATGKPYHHGQVSYFGKTQWDYYTEHILSVFTSVFVMVMVIALAISLLGLAISMITSIYQRQKEIGTLRAVGFSRKHVLVLIYGEAMVLGIMGIIVGFVAGLHTASIMIAQVPFLPFLAIIYTPPYASFVTSAVLLGVVMLATAVLPAYKSMRLDIATVLRAPE